MGFHRWFPPIPSTVNRKKNAHNGTEYPFYFAMLNPRMHPLYPHYPQKQCQSKIITTETINSNEFQCLPESFHF